MAFSEKKSPKLWIWKAYCRHTRWLLDWECGDRDYATCHRLITRLQRWSVQCFYADHGEVYPKTVGTTVPLVQSKAETHGVERNNAIQRHWFARFRRKSLVVSKSKQMVDLTMAMYAAFHFNKTVPVISLVC